MVAVAVMTVVIAESHVHAWLEGHMSGVRTKERTTDGDIKQRSSECRAMS